MKKIFFGFSMLLLPFLAQAQVERIVVEKYYQANAADHQASLDNDVTNNGLNSQYALPVGAVTYRIYVDMADGYKILGVHGNTVHTMFIRTSTFFYNNAESSASGTATWNKAGNQQNVRLLDSYLAMGAPTTQVNTWGILKADDGAAGGTNLSLSGTTIQDQTLLPSPKTNDGFYTVTPTAPYNAAPYLVSAVSFAGIDGSIFGDGTTNGNNFTCGVGTPILSGTWYALNGVSTDPTLLPGNRVLVAQLTTDGRLEFELNVNVQAIAGGPIIKYVARNPLSDETVLASLTYDSDNVPFAPTVTLSAPASGRIGNSITLSATPADANGNNTIDSVVFFAGATRLGRAIVTPYQLNYILSATTTFTAVAYDNTGLSGTSSPVTVNAVSNVSPVISNFTVIPGTVKAGRTFNFSATVTDDIAVSSVMFSYNGVSITPTVAGNVYSGSAVAVLGQNSVSISATDNESAVSNGSASLSVITNPAPSVSITAPLNNAQVNINTPVTFVANATDDESVASVQFFVEGAPVSTPYTFTAQGSYNITAQATDNQGAVSALSAAVRVNVIDPASLPYQVTDVKKKCSDEDLFFIPVVALKSVSNVIGFDMVMKFDPSKVLPTSIWAINNDLIDSTLATANLSVSGDSILISVSLNSSAPENTFFHGTSTTAGRQVIALQFAKTNNFAPVDTARFSVRKLEESYFTSVLPAVRIGSGMFTSYKDSLFNGSLKFWSGNEAMGYTAGTNLITRIFGNINTSLFVTPDANGNFVYPISRGQSISIRRDIADLTSVQSVINGMDGLLTQKVLLDDASFKPSVFQAVAMDVNIDGRISAGDLSQISQRSVRRIAEYKQAWNYNDAGVKVVNAPSKDWLFINDSTLAMDAHYLISKNYPAADGLGFSKFFVPKVDTLQALPIQNYATCPVISGQTFRGVLLGDVNGSYKTLPQSATLKSAQAQVVFDFANAIETENSIEVPVYTIADAQALDFTIVTSANLEFAGIVKKSKNYVDNSVEGSKEISLFSFGTFKANESALAIRFNKNGAVSASDLAVKAAYVNGSAVNSKSTVSVAKASVKIYPNPVSEELFVEVSENSKVQVYDLSGKVISESQAFVSEQNAISVKTFKPGLYMVKVSNNSGVNTQKVVVK